MQKPVLYIFNISHYCEKARWALDYFGIAHEVRHVMLGQHRSIARRLGAARGSVPFLQTGEGVIAGSSAIIDWCEAQPASRQRARPETLATDDPAMGRALEQRLDDVIGVHVRRFYYSDALTNAPASVRPIFSNGLPLWQRMAVTIAWPRIVPMMLKGMDLGPAQGLQSQAILEGELAWLEGLLADGRPYLTGNRWSRVDLTAASLLAPLAGPKEHPVVSAVVFPPNVSKVMQAWAQRPALRYVRDMYTRHR
jgi:glutathione S-transferase